MVDSDVTVSVSVLTTGDVVGVEVICAALEVLVDVRSGQLGCSGGHE